MNRSRAHLVHVVASLSLITLACSSSNDPAPSGPADGGKASSEGAACFKDKEELAKDDAAKCCDGLFKHCRSASMAGDETPCSCSTVECGTKANPPPPNVRCCPGLAETCETVIGSNETNCVCE